MAGISRTHVSLRYWGDDLKPDELTASLGREPNSSATKGQVIKGKVSGTERIAKTGGWSFKVEAREPGDLDAQIHEVFSSLTADLSVWRDLATRYKSDLFVGLFMRKRNEVAEISAESLALLSSRGISLTLDIYDPVDDD